MLENFVFDYSDFQKKLLAVSQQGFQLLKDRHKNETFYCFAFYSHGSLSFLYPAASSEEGLTRVAQHYINHHPKPYGQVSLADMRTSLRHSIADSPLNEPDLMLPIFEEVCDLAWKRSSELNDIWSNLADQIGEDPAFELIQPHEDQFMETCFSVLRQLDGEGMFGTGLEREHVVLNFLMGDQSEFETSALAVNPKHIVERYLAEIQAGYAIAKRIHSDRYNDAC
jgi:hypothetical protein